MGPGIAKADISQTAPIHCFVFRQEILENLRSQILAPIPPQALSSLRGLADQMEKILLLALEHYGSTFVEPKVELGARFGHLVCKYRLSLTETG